MCANYCIFCIIHHFRQGVRFVALVLGHIWDSSLRSNGFFQNVQTIPCAYRSRHPMSDLNISASLYCWKILNRDNWAWWWNSYVTQKTCDKKNTVPKMKSCEEYIIRCKHYVYMAYNTWNNGWNDKNFKPREILSKYLQQLINVIWQQYNNTWQTSRAKQIRVDKSINALKLSSILPCINTIELW